MMEISYLWVLLGASSYGAITARWFRKDIHLAYSAWVPFVSLTLIPIAVAARADAEAQSNVDWGNVVSFVIGVGMFFMIHLIYIWKNDRY